MKVLLGAVFAAVLLATSTSLYVGTKIAERPVVVLANSTISSDTFAALQTSSIISIARSHGVNLSPVEAKFVQRAIKHAQPCTAIESCDGLIEWSGGSLSHTVPHIVQGSDGANGRYAIVVGREAHAAGGYSGWWPEFVVYHYDHEGIVTRIDEEDRISVRWPGISEHIPEKWEYNVDDEAKDGVHLRTLATAAVEIRL